MWRVRVPETKQTRVRHTFSMKCLGDRPRQHGARSCPTDSEESAAERGAWSAGAPWRLMARLGPSAFWPRVEFITTTTSAAECRVAGSEFFSPRGRRQTANSPKRKSKTEATREANIGRAAWKTVVQTGSQARVPDKLRGRSLRHTGAVDDSRDLRRWGAGEVERLHAPVQLAQDEAGHGARVDHRVKVGRLDRRAAVPAVEAARL